MARAHIDLSQRVDSALSAIAVVVDAVARDLSGVGTDAVVMIITIARAVGHGNRCLARRAGPDLHIPVPPSVAIDVCEPGHGLAAISGRGAVRG